MACDRIRSDNSFGNIRTDNHEKSLMVDTLAFAINFDPNPIILGYPRYAKYTE